MLGSGQYEASRTQTQRNPNAEQFAASWNRGAGQYAANMTRELEREEIEESENDSDIDGDLPHSSDDNGDKG